MENYIEDLKKLLKNGPVTTFCKNVETLKKKLDPLNENKYRYRVLNYGYYTNSMTIEVQSSCDVDYSYVYNFGSLGEYKIKKPLDNFDEISCIKELLKNGPVITFCRSIETLRNSLEDNENKYNYKILNIIGDSQTAAENKTLVEISDKNESDKSDDKNDENKWDLKFENDEPKLLDVRVPNDNFVKYMESIGWSPCKDISYSKYDTRVLFEKLPHVWLLRIKYIDDHEDIHICSSEEICKKKINDITIENVLKLINDESTVCSDATYYKLIRNGFNLKLFDDGSKKWIHEYESDINFLDLHWFNTLGTTNNEPFFTHSILKKYII
jgi:hypothetical protein